MDGLAFVFAAMGVCMPMMTTPMPGRAARVRRRQP